MLPSPSTVNHSQWMIVFISHPYRWDLNPDRTRLADIPLVDVPGHRLRRIDDRGWPTDPVAGSRRRAAVIEGQAEHLIRHLFEETCEQRVARSRLELFAVLSVQTVDGGIAESALVESGPVIRFTANLGGDELRHQVISNGATAPPNTLAQRDQPHALPPRETLGDH